MSTSSYFKQIRNKVDALGGFFNAHLHLDRSGTHDATKRMLQKVGRSRENSSLSLSAKHALIPSIHASECYSPQSLMSRGRAYLEELIDSGTTRADTLVDVTLDNVALVGLEVYLSLKNEYQADIDLRVAAYSPLGFKDSEPGRWKLLEEAAQLADFIAGLPERDDHEDYPDHIGYEESCRRMFELSFQLGKPLHLHVDQKNLASENGAERALSVMTTINNLPSFAKGQDALIWFVHMISSASYEESRFARLLSNLASHHVGVICCPSAAISMRQHRPRLAPTHNSIARVLDLLATGIPVRIGSDNIFDITSPGGTTDLVDELFVLCNTIRFYDIEILSKLAAGISLSHTEQIQIKTHLGNDHEETLQALAQERESTFQPRIFKAA